MEIGQYEFDLARLWESLGISIVSGSYLSFFLTPEKWPISVGSFVGGIVLVGLSASTRKRGYIKKKNLEEELEIAKLKHKKRN